MSHCHGGEYRQERIYIETYDAQASDPLKQPRNQHVIFSSFLDVIVIFFPAQKMGP